MVERILDSALQIVHSEGVDGATTLAIAAHAGLSVGSLYQYFPNKDAILLELARRWLAAFPPIIDARQREPVATTWDEFAQQIKRFIREIGALYSGSYALLPIVEAMYNKIGLDRIVQDHDVNIIRLHAKWLRSINPSMTGATADRLGLIMLEIGHSCLSSAIRLPRPEFDLILEDLETVHLELLRPYVGLRSR